MKSITPELINSLTPIFIAMIGIGITLVIISDKVDLVFSSMENLEGEKNAV